MIDTMKVAQCPHHRVHLNADFQSDVQWWASFLPQWNGRSIMPQPGIAHSSAADASGNWGCGAISKEGWWFQIEWPQSWSEHHIAAKEMVPVVGAVAIWGPQWRVKTVLVIPDNMAVVCAVSAGSAKDVLLMHLLRCLHFFTAHHQIVLRAEHLPGVLNSATDSLSRNNLPLSLIVFLRPPNVPPQCPSSC